MRVVLESQNWVPSFRCQLLPLTRAQAEFQVLKLLQQDLHAEPSEATRPCLRLSTVLQATPSRSFGDLAHSMHDAFCICKMNYVNSSSSLRSWMQQHMTLAHGDLKSTPNVQHTSARSRKSLQNTVEFRTHNSSLEEADHVDDLLKSVSETIGMKKASEYQYENFRRWFDLKNPVVQEEIDFLRYPQDIVALGGADHGWLFHKLEEANSRFFTDKARPSSSHEMF